MASLVGDGAFSDALTSEPPKQSAAKLIADAERIKAEGARAARNRPRASSRGRAATPARRPPRPRRARARVAAANRPTGRVRSGVAARRQRALQGQGVQEGRDALREDPRVHVAALRRSRAVRRPSGNRAAGPAARDVSETDRLRLGEEDGARMPPPSHAVLKPEGGTPAGTAAARRPRATTRRRTARPPRGNRPSRCIFFCAASEPGVLLNIISARFWRISRPARRAAAYPRRRGSPPARPDRLRQHGAVLRRTRRVPEGAGLQRESRGPRRGARRGDRAEILPAGP